MEEVKSKEDLFLKGMLLAMLCWGFSWVSNKILASYGVTDNIVLLRFITTFIALAIMMPFLKEKFYFPLRGLPVLLMATICLTAYSYCFIGGLKRGMPGAGGVLVTTLTPILTFVTSLIYNRMLPSKKETLGLGLGIVAGVFLLQLWQKWDLVFSQGNLFFLLAATLWSVLSRFTAAAKAYSSSVTFSFWMYVCCSTITFFFTDNTETLRIVTEGDGKFWFNLFFSGTVTTALATTFYFFATVKIGANKASSFIFLVPLSAALGAWIFIGEIPQWYTIVGGLIGIAAVYVLTKK